MASLKVPLPWGDVAGIELIAYLDHKSAQSPTKHFYTDSNGLKMEKRSSVYKNQLGERFYPVNSAITNGAESSWFTIFTDRTFAASAVNSRTEILINRQLTTVDSSGSAEPLDETGPSGHGYILQASFALSLS